MAVATTAPTALEQPQVAYEPIAIPRHTLRWGPPIWAADQPVATLDRSSVGQVDIITMSVIMAYRPE